MTDADYLLAFTTASSVEEAERLAQTLVAERLIACANRIGPIHSTYRWQGQVENETEYLLMMKTTKLRWEQLERRLTELHSYDTPELIQVPIRAGLPAYLSWVRAECAPGPSD